MTLRSRLLVVANSVKAYFGQLLNFVMKELWPVKGEKYFTDKILLMGRIREDKRNGYFLYEIYALLGLSFLLSVVQCFHDHPTIMLLTFDYIGVNHLFVDVKISKAMINIAAFYFYKYTYFTLGRVSHFPLFKTILIDNDRTFVLGSTKDFWKLIIGILRFYQVLVVGFELWLIGVYIQFCVALSQHCLSPIYLWPLAYLSMSIGFVLFSATVLLICVGGLTGSIGLSVIFGMFERIKISTRRYLHHPVNRFTSARLLRYRRENAKTMRLEFEIAPIYGTLLAAFLVTNIPSNVSFIVILMLGTSSNVSVNFMCIIVVFGQITVLIFFHLVAALVTTRLHHPYKAINSQFVRYKSKNLAGHIRLANNIQTFLVNKRYGISYNMLGLNFGLVSMTAFLKFIIFYSEMILYSFSMYLESNSKKLIHKFETSN